MALRRGDTGAVTAEAAVALPVLVVVAVALAWMVTVGITQVRVHDAAREVARSAARSDDAGTAVALGRRVAPAGSRVSVRHRGEEVVATVTASVRPPGGLLGRWASVRVRGVAVAAAEPTYDEVGP